VAIYLLESGFFDNMVQVRVRITAHYRYEEFWNAYIQGLLRSEKFWHDIAGLNEDIPILSSEAGQRRLLHQKAALVGGLIFAGLLVLPLAIRVLIATPGTVVRLLNWVGSRLMLASQYAYSTHRAFGFLAGSAQLTREAYTYYLQNPIAINQGILDATEFFV